jgi:hypothetical protein
VSRADEIFAKSVDGHFGNRKSGTLNRENSIFSLLMSFIGKKLRINNKTIVTSLAFRFEASPFGRLACFACSCSL